MRITAQAVTNGAGLHLVAGFDLQNLRAPEQGVGTYVWSQDFRFIGIETLGVLRRSPRKGVSLLANFVWLHEKLTLRQPCRLYSCGRDIKFQIEEVEWLYQSGRVFIRGRNGKLQDLYGGAQS